MTRGNRRELHITKRTYTIHREYTQRRVYCNIHKINVLTAVDRAGSRCVYRVRVYVYRDYTEFT